VVTRLADQAACSGAGGNHQPVPTRQHLVIEAGLRALLAHGIEVGVDRVEAVLQLLGAHAQAHGVGRGPGAQVQDVAGGGVGVVGVGEVGP